MKPHASEFRFSIRPFIGREAGGRQVFARVLPAPFTYGAPSPSGAAGV